MKVSNRSQIIILSLVLLLLLSLITCIGDDDNDSQPLAVPSEEIDGIVTPKEKTIITIGNYTDITGPSANASAIINMALEDMVQYYNEGDLIPGVKFEVIDYDSQVDPANDIPGYEWLKEHGADVLFTYLPSAPITLKSRVEEDKMVLFSLVPDREAMTPPGYVFAPGAALVEHHIYALLKWLAENDPDFPNGRPARIGGAGWATGYMDAAFEGVKEYAQAHPEQYDWVGGYITGVNFTWQMEVEALKDCDYLIPPMIMNQFAELYRSSGYTGKFIGTSLHTAFLSTIDKSDTWEEIDGMQIIMCDSWWNEECQTVNLAKKLLQSYHPEQLEEMMRTSNGYLSVGPIYIIFELIRKTVNEVGPENFSSQTMYDAASDFSLNTDGRETDSFSKTKRLSRNWFAIYEYDAEERDLVRINPDEWLDVILEP